MRAVPDAGGTSSHPSRTIIEHHRRRPALQWSFHTAPSFHRRKLQQGRFRLSLRVCPCPHQRANRAAAVIPRRAESAMLLSGQVGPCVL
jgi:hypothetical protein